MCIGSDVAYNTLAIFFYETLCQSDKLHVVII